MGDWYCDSKDGSDGNGGTSWGNAKRSIAALKILGSDGDNYNLLGHGFDYTYAAAQVGVSHRNWLGVRTSGLIPGGMPVIVMNGNRTNDGPDEAYRVSDLYFQNALRALEDKQGNFGDIRDVVERCIFDDCEDGVHCAKQKYITMRHCLVFGCKRGIRFQGDASADPHYSVHHNTYDAMEFAGVSTVTGVGEFMSFDDFHSNIFSNSSASGAFGVYLSSDGSLTFHTAGEPNYNVWYNNDTDMSRASKGTNKIEADPEFFDRTNEDFRLAIGSPCLQSDGSGKNRGPFGPVMTVPYRMRHGIFMPADGYKVQAETLFRDSNLIGN